MKKATSAPTLSLFSEDQYIPKVKEKKLSKIDVWFDDIEFDIDPRFKLIDNLHDLKPVLEEIKKKKLVALDTETTGLDFKTCEIVGMSICYDTLTSYYLPFRTANTTRKQLDWDKTLPLLQEVFSDKSIRVIFHNAKFDTHFFYEAGLTFAGPVDDTMIMAHLLDENRPKGLKYLAESFFEKADQWDRALDKFFAKYARAFKIPKGTLTYDLIHLDLMVQYAAADTYFTFQLYLRLWDQIKKNAKFVDLYHMEIFLMKVLVEVEGYGVLIDREFVKKAMRTCTEKLRNLEKRILEATQTPLDLNSSMKIGDFLKSKKISTGKMTKSEKNPRMSVDQKSLERVKHRHPMIPLLLDYRKVKKLHSTYFSAFLREIETPEGHLRDDGKIHCNFKQLGAKTGRLCVSGDTLLKTNKGHFEISKLDLSKIQNVQVMTHHGRERRILRRFYKGKEQMHHVVLEDGRSITCTKGHHFLTPVGWMSLTDCIKNKLSIITEKNIQKFDKSEKIKRIEDAGVQDVWDIEVEEDHSYIAHGFVNHNSCSNPNLQNISRPSDDAGLNVRSSFIPRSDEYAMLFIDLSQIELRMTAHYSQDPILIDSYIKGEDIHTRTACEMFHLSKEEVGEKRNDAKTMNFALIYGAGEARLASMLGKTKEEARQFQNLYFSKYRGVQQFIKRTHQIVLERGWVENFYGRVRRLPEVHNTPSNHRKYKYIMQRACRQGTNFLIQSTCADLFKIAMCRVHSFLKKNNTKSQLILNVHDEVILYLHMDEIHFIPQIKDCLEDFHEFRVPIIADVKYSLKNWAEKEDLIVPDDLDKLRHMMKGRQDA